MTLHHLFNFAQKQFIGRSPLGIMPFIVEHGVDEALKRKPFDAADAYSLDEVMDLGCPHFVVSRAVGSQATGKMVGKDPVTGQTVSCEPRGVEGFAEVAAILPDWVPAFKKRTARSRAMNGRSMAYVGCLPLDFLPASLTANQRDTRLAAVLRPYLEAGFTDLGLDAAAVLGWTSGRKPATAHLATAALKAGLRVSIESIEAVTPALFHWHDGRFGAISMEARWKLATDGSGYFGPGVHKCVTGWYLWLQGHLTPAQRLALVNRWSGTAGVEFIVELAQMTREEIAAMVGGGA